MSRADRAAKAILEGIARGEYPVGDELPAEADLAASLGVSRLTLREAVKSLAAKGVLIVRHGKRAQVADPDSWDLLDAELMRLRGALRGEERQLALKMMEVRRIVEVGAAELAAERISDSRLSVLAEQIEVMERAGAADDVETVVAADLRFHQLIVEAAENEYLLATYRPLTEVLQAVRRRTSAPPAVRADADHWHRQVLDALRTHQSNAAIAAMEGHMRQTQRAIEKEIG